MGLHRQIDTFTPTLCGSLNIMKSDRANRMGLDKEKIYENEILNP